MEYVTKTMEIKVYDDGDHIGTYETDGVDMWVFCSTNKGVFCMTAIIEILHKLNQLNQELIYRNDTAEYEASLKEKGIKP